MFPPAKKKPDMSVVLGIGGKPPREQAPPPFQSPAAPEEAIEGAGEGACSITCPKCGEALNLQVAPVPETEPAEPGVGEEAEPEGVE